LWEVLLESLTEVSLVFCLDDELLWVVPRRLAQEQVSAHEKQELDSLTDSLMEVSLVASMEEYLVEHLESLMDELSAALMAAKKETRVAAYLAES
jgi:hypothetical protein